VRIDEALDQTRSAAGMLQLVFSLEFTLESRVANSAPVPGSEVLKVPRPKVQVGSVLGRIDIPRIGVSVMVLEGSTSYVFRRAAGHLEGTATPGEPGNVAIAAHRDSFFRPLRNIRSRDLISFSTLTGSYLYQVESTDIVGSGDVQVLTDSPQLDSGHLRSFT
jgi:LPXTG-site transpeptidase (sortase) family protein